MFNNIPLISNEKEVNCLNKKRIRITNIKYIQVWGIFTFMDEAG